MDPTSSSPSSSSSLLSRLLAWLTPKSEVTRSKLPETKKQDTISFETKKLQTNSFDPFGLDGLTEIILMFLDVFDVAEVRLVNKTWKRLSLRAQEKVFKEFEEKNHSINIRGKWTGSGHIFHVKGALSLQYPKKKTEEDEEQIPTLVPVTGTLRWKLVGAPRDGWLEKKVNQVEIEWVEGEFCPKTRSLHIDGVCRSGILLCGKNEPGYGAFPCKSIGCRCIHYTTPAYAETPTTRCSKCTHTHEDHGKTAPWDHIIAVDKYKMQLPLDAHLFKGTTLGLANDWSGRIVLVRDFPNHTEKGTWNW